MSLWGSIFAAGYNRFMAASEGAGLARFREDLLKTRAHGRVLEIGAGTGANLPFYTPAVTELVMSEPEEAMTRRLERRLPHFAIRSRILRAPAERLPLESASFDAVVATLVLCTVSHPARALAEVRRVLRPRGRLLFIEHVRSSDPGIARWQDRLRRPWSWFACGCECNRSTVESISASGFSVNELRIEELPKSLPIVRPLAIGVAVLQA